MPSRSEIQPWLVAIHCHSGNSNPFFQKSCLFLVCFRDVKLNRGLLQAKVILEFELQILQKLCLFRYVFEIWNSTVACCNSRSFWKLKCDCMKEVCHLSVCQRDLKFSVACYDSRSFWNLKSEFFRNSVFFGMPSRSETQRWLVAS